MNNCQKFSLVKDCISTYFQMSLFGADFLRNASRLLYVHGKNTPDVQVAIYQKKILF